MNLSTQHIAIGQLQIDVAQQRITRNGEHCIVPARVQRLLFYLVENPDRVLSKHELNINVWDGRPVEDSVFSHTMWQVRQLLGDADRQIIHTVPKKGYLFRAPKSPKTEQFFLTQTPSEISPMSRDAVTEVKQHQISSTSRSVWGPLMWALVILTLVTGVLLYQRSTRLAETIQLQLIDESPDPEVSSYVSGLVVRITSQSKRPVTLLSPQAPVSAKTWVLRTQLDSAATISLSIGDSSTIAMAVAANESFRDALQHMLKKAFIPSGALVNAKEQGHAIEMRDFDFVAIWENHQKQLRTGQVNADGLATLAFVLNELGRGKAAIRFAEEALKSNVLRSDARCLAEFVIADASESRPISASQLSCPLAAARELERLGQIVAARKAAATIPTGEFAIAQGMKLAEVAMRLDIGVGSSAAALQRIDNLIDLAEKTGWRAAKPRLLELRAANFSLVGNVDARIATFSDAELLYRQLGDSINADRMWLRQIRSALKLTSVERQRIADIRAQSTNPRLRVLAVLAQARFDYDGLAFSANLDAMLREIELLPSAIEKIESLDALRSIASGLSSKEVARLSALYLFVSEQFPVLRVNAQISLAVSNEDLAKSVLLGVEAEKQAEKLGVVDSLTTSFCVLGSIAQSAKKYPQAQHWSQRCIRGAIASEYNCVRYWGYSTQFSLARSGIEKMPSFAQLDAVEAIAAARKTNCALGLSKIASQLIRSGRYKEAELFWQRHIKNVPESPQKSREQMLVSAELCLFRGGSCEIDKIQEIIANESKNNTFRASLLALKVGLKKGTCSVQDAELINAWLPKNFVRGYPGLHRALQCAAKSCIQKRLACTPIQIAVSE
jgi:DNA-binding winged helix-turn-helix (wHTH) protein/tetratricopeptide (TPR) repeat protein